MFTTSPKALSYILDKQPLPPVNSICSEYTIIGPKLDLLNPNFYEEARK